MYTTDGISHTHDDFDATARILRSNRIHGSTAMRKTTIQRLAASMLTGVSMLVLAPSASAQFWGRGAQPNSGACFYEDINYGGRYFCTRVGDNNPRVPSNINDEISSIRLFGDAEVIAFRDGNMRGESRVFASGVRDLRRAGFNDRLTSYVVQPRGYGNGNWGGSYNGGYYNNNGRYDNGAYNNGGYYDRGRGGYDPNYGSTYGRGPTWGREGRSRWTVPQAESMVRQGYRRVFGRDPDPGARGWDEQVMTNNWSQRQLEEALRNSPEGRNR
jgi:hypothetical protein